jgi:hypothetical protein
VAFIGRSISACILAPLPLEGDRDARGTIEILACVLAVPEGDKKWYLSPTPHHFHP